jgi:hypothetical protein
MEIFEKRPWLSFLFQILYTEFLNPRKP